jgi:hypothetical protein
LRRRNSGRARRDLKFFSNLPITEEATRSRNRRRSTVIDAISSALSGMQRNQEAFGRHADRIARSGLESEGGETIDLSKELVGAMVARRGYEANLPVIRAADDMLGSLLDALA